MPERHGGKHDNDCRSAAVCTWRPTRVAGQGRNSWCDAVILDLEDAVAANKKEKARASLLTELRCDVAVRINSINSAWFIDDNSCLSNPRIVAVILPKTESVDDIK